MNLSVTTGTPFVVELASAPGTGYLWEPRDLPSGVRLISSDYRQQAGAAIGDPGVQVFALIVDEPGRWTLFFDLKRPWESTAVQSEVVEVTSG